MTANTCTLTNIDVVLTLPDTATFQYIQDPGHGWLEVKRWMVDLAGVSELISDCSYANNEYVYLEEDSDFQIFTNKLTSLGVTVSFIEVYQENTPIRDYPHYEPTGYCLNGAYTDAALIDACKRVFLAKQVKDERQQKFDREYARRRLELVLAGTRASHSHYCKSYATAVLTAENQWQNQKNDQAA